MVKFLLELIDEVEEITEKIRESEPVKLSRNQFYNQILLEWCRMKGYIKKPHNEKQAKIEELKKQVAALENQ